MELWIRSQDKFDLIQTRSLSVTKGDYDEIMIFANGIGIGTYKSKERALEVLDKIQKYLTPTIQMLDETIGNKQVCQIGTIMTIVYEMPQE